MRFSSAALAAILVLVSAACGDETRDPCIEEPCLDVPADGMQLRSTGKTIQPGEDRELCEIVRLPGDPDQRYHVDRFELAMTPGSHHLIVAAIRPGSETEAQVAEGDIIDCVGPTGFGEEIEFVTGSQLPTYEEAYPEGVGKVYRGGQYLVFNYHYFNATDAPIEGRAAINLLTTDASRIDKVMGLLAFARLDIATPPGQERSFPVDCRVDDDVMVHKLMRHTHRWGTDFPVELAGGARDGEQVYVSPSYEEPDHVFDQPLRLSAGEGFRFSCNYINTTSQTLEFGVKATDEMCILFGLVFSPVDREVPDQICVVDAEAE
jgi:Copper type II ascorbate-dependent monooxygenase, C-terminal domain